MQLRSLNVENYRSLKAIRMDLAAVNLFIGANGVGKSNLYRALELVQAAVRGRLAHAIAAEGGMGSALWSGTRRMGEPVRIKLAVELQDRATAVSLRYEVEAGLRPPAAAGFALEPQLKTEVLSVETGTRPVVVLKRSGPGIMVRGASGRMEEYPERALNSETAVALLGDAGHYPEIGLFRRAIDQWRFYHGLRSDRDSPLRHPSLAVTSPLLDEDGGNLAAVFATLVHTREDTVELDRMIAVAFDGARLTVPHPGAFARFELVFPEFPARPFSPAELSDGQIRFLGLAGALMAYRRAPLIALNEPEASLHPQMLEPLADMIAAAAAHSQIWIVTHSERLADAVAERCGIRARRVVREQGRTSIGPGMLESGAEDGDEA